MRMKAIVAIGAAEGELVGLEALDNLRAQHRLGPLVLERSEVRHAAHGLDRAVEGRHILPRPAQVARNLLGVSESLLQLTLHLLRIAVREVVVRAALTRELAVAAVQAATATGTAATLLATSPAALTHLLSLLALALLALALLALLALLTLLTLLALLALLALLSLPPLRRTFLRLAHLLLY